MNYSFKPFLLSVFFCVLCSIELNAQFFQRTYLNIGIGSSNQKWEYQETPDSSGWNDFTENIQFSIHHEIPIKSNQLVFGTGFRTSGFDETRALFDPETSFSYYGEYQDIDFISHFVFFDVNYKVSLLKKRFDHLYIYSGLGINYNYKNSLGATYAVFLDDLSLLYPLNKINKFNFVGNFGIGAKLGKRLYYNLGTDFSIIDNSTHEDLKISNFNFRTMLGFYLKKSS